MEALAYLTMPALIGPILGPPLGGFITTYLHWRWIFWINVPIGVLGVTLATLFIPNVRETEVWPLDMLGFVLSGLGLSALMFGFTVAGRGFVSVPLNVGADRGRRASWWRPMCCMRGAPPTRSSTCSC